MTKTIQLDDSPISKALSYTERERLLFVTQDKALFHLVRCMLKAYRVDVAATPAQAMAVLSETSYDGLLLDLYAVECLASPTFKILCQLPKLPPTVILTADVTGSSQSQLCDSHYPEIVYKPFTSIVLCQAIQSAV